MSRKLSVHQFTQLMRDALAALEGQWADGIITNPRAHPEVMTLSSWQRELEAIDLSGEEEE